jgi:hypothetical protein
MHLPDHFAVYNHEKNSFQLLKLDKTSDCGVVALVPWSMPQTALTHPYTNQRWDATTTDTERANMLPWFRGNEWYIMPTGHTKTHFYKVEIDGRSYIWWSLHHRLYWSNARVYTDMLQGKNYDWSQSPTIPIVEFAYKRVLPRHEASVYPNWSEVSIQNFKNVNTGCWMEYLDYMSTHVDPKNLRIQTPIPVENNTEDSETDTEERVTRAPRFRFGTPSVEIQTNMDDEDDHKVVSNLCAYVIITLLICSFVSLYAFILLSTLSSNPE